MGAIAERGGRMSNTEKVREQIQVIIDYQFKGMTTLLPEAYEDSLRMIKDQILAIPGLRVELEV